MKKKFLSGNSFLLDKYNKIKPNTKEQASRLTWINFITNEIKKIYSSATIDLFGSFYTGLYVHSSDIDLSIRIDTNSPNTILKSIKTALTKTTHFYALVHLSHAKIPILKFKCKKYGFKFDISINNDGGVQAANFIVKKIQSDPIIKIFAVLFKHFIYNRKLGDASVGGLNSYSQLLMIISYLDMHPFYNQLNEKYLAVLFFDFIQFYAFDFKYKNVQIDCKNKAYKVNTMKRLSIIDPTDYSIDVGACCKNMDKVVDTLQNFYRLILFHYENRTLENLFNEMFYIDSEELEPRSFVISNYNSKVVISRKKTRSTSLREVNMYKNNINNKKDINLRDDINKDDINYKDDFNYKDNINIKDKRDNKDNINYKNLNLRDKSNEDKQIVEKDIVETEINVKKTKHEDLSVNTKKSLNPGLYDKFVDDMTSENNTIEKKLKKKQRKAAKHRKNADAKSKK